MRVIIINGPNLNLLGQREVAIYGNISFDDYLKQLETDFPNIAIDYFQSNVEGELIDKLHEVGFSYDTVLLNAGGYTHTSVALMDCIAAITVPVYEVHISNPLAREEFRHNSLVGQKCVGTVSGFGLDSYRLAVEGILSQLAD